VGLAECSDAQLFHVTEAYFQRVTTIRRIFSSLATGVGEEFRCFCIFFLTLFSSGRSIDNKIKLRCGNFQSSELCRRFDACND
jgi:hypothetical protein